MTAGNSTILIDTNVLVYAHDPRDRRKQERALAVLDRLMNQGHVALSVPDGPRIRAGHRRGVPRLIPE